MNENPHRHCEEFTLQTGVWLVVRPKVSGLMSVRPGFLGLEPLGFDGDGVNRRRDR